MWSGNTTSGTGTNHVQSGLSPLRERPAVEDIFGQFEKSERELGVGHYKKICPDFVMAMMIFV